jgi:hypothetical protein
MGFLSDAKPYWPAAQEAMNSLKDARASTPTKSEGRKFDSNKPRWSLLPTGTVSLVIEILEIGAAKYEEDNWKQVPNARKRYYNALMRHTELWWSGEKIDEESGKLHMAHVVCNALFLLWFDKESK